MVAPLASDQSNRKGWTRVTWLKARERVSSPTLPLPTFVSIYTMQIFQVHQTADFSAHLCVRSQSSSFDDHNRLIWWSNLTPWRGQTQLLAFPLDNDILACRQSIKFPLRIIPAVRDMLDSSIIWVLNACVGYRIHTTLYPSYIQNNSTCWAPFIQFANVTSLPIFILFHSTCPQNTCTPAVKAD